MIENDKTHKETAYKLENIIEKVEEGGYGEEIEETGRDQEDEAEIYDNEAEAEAEAEEQDDDEDEIYDPNEPEEYDEKEYIREAAEIGPSVRLF